jgi:hypothetical protein
LLETYDNQIKEYEWRLNIMRENELPATIIPPWRRLTYESDDIGVY